MAVIALAACMAILMFGVGRGIEKANKILMPVFFVLFVILGIYVFFSRVLQMGIIISFVWIKPH